MTTTVDKFFKLLDAAQIVSVNELLVQMWGPDTASAVSFHDDDSAYKEVSLTKQDIEDGTMSTDGTFTGMAKGKPVEIKFFKLTQLAL